MCLLILVIGNDNGVELQQKQLPRCDHVADDGDANCMTMALKKVTAIMTILTTMMIMTMMLEMPLMTNFSKLLRRALEPLPSLSL